MVGNKDVCGLGMCGIARRVAGGSKVDLVAAGMGDGRVYQVAAGGVRSRRVSGSRDDHGCGVSRCRKDIVGGKVDGCTLRMTSTRVVGDDHGSVCAWTLRITSTRVVGDDHGLE
jgi:hypothetical protein